MISFDLRLSFIFFTKRNNRISDSCSLVRDWPGVCQLFLSYDTYWRKEWTTDDREIFIQLCNDSKQVFLRVLTRLYYETANRRRIDKDNVDIIVSAVSCYFFSKKKKNYWFYPCVITRNFPSVLHENSNRIIFNVTNRGYILLRLQLRKYSIILLENFYIKLKI